MMVLVLSEDPADTLMNLAEYGVDTTTEIKNHNLCDFVINETEIPLISKLPVYEDFFTAFLREIQPLEVQIGRLMEGVELDGVA